MSRPHEEKRHGGRRGRRRGPHGPNGDARKQPRIILTPEGFPAAVPDEPPPSTAVFVSEESLARYPWLPPRVIAGSVWRGPGNTRVQVDEGGHAHPWRAGPGSPRS